MISLSKKDTIPVPCPAMAETEKYRNNAETLSILMDAGIEMMRQNLVRRHPEASETQINRLLISWLHRSDNPIPGDTAGAIRVREQMA